MTSDTQDAFFCCSVFRPLRQSPLNFLFLIKALHSDATCFLSIGLSVFTCTHSSQHSQYTTMIEWTQTGTVHCNIWCVFRQCLNNQIHASLFHLAFCFHQHITHILAFTLAALNHTHDTSNNGLSFAALSASPIVCFSSSSSSFSRYSADSVQKTMSFKHGNETKWNDAKQKTRHSFHHLLPGSEALLRFSSLFRCSAFDIACHNSWLMLLSVYEERKGKELFVDVCLWCVFFLLYSPPRSSHVSVVFDFNDSLNDFAPVSPILLSVDLMRKGKEWIVDRCLLCVFFLLSSPLRLSWVSVVFDFNAPLNDVVPLSPIQLPVDEKRKGKSELLMDVFCLSSFVFTSQIEFRECCVWFQCFTQWCCSCCSNAVVCWFDEKGKEWIVDGCLLCDFFLLSSHLRLSLVSVVFDFNASLNDVAPVSLR